MKFFCLNSSKSPCLHLSLGAVRVDKITVVPILSCIQEYPVSSLFGGLSRDPTRSMMFTREKMQAVPQVDPLYEGKSGSQSRSHSVSSGKDKLEELHEKYLEL